MSPDPQAPGVDDLSLEPVGDWLRWRLEARCCLNPGSPGAPLVWLRLIPADDRARLLANWTAGDLAEIRCGVAAPATPLRRYSIASLPQDGGLELLVRESRHPDGRLGAGSAFLLQAMQAGDVLDLRLQALPAFHAPRGDSVPPMILIGNGSGMASLRALLRLRARQEQAAGRNSGRNCWLLYGERSKAHDQPFADELRDLQGRGVLTHLDLAFSREADAGAPRYVQDLLQPHADRLRRWVRVGAMFYVCGSAQGMAPGVDMALRAALGDAVVSRLFRERRIRREVY